MGLLVSEARTEFKIRKQDIADIDDISGTFMQWCNYVNRYAYKLLTNVMPETYISTQTYSFVSGTSEYALPSAFQDVIPQGTGLYRVDTQGKDTTMRLPLTGFGSSKSGYYITLDDIVLTPEPTTSSTYKLRFIPLLTELSAETSEFIIPKRFSQYVMNALDQCYNIWDEDPNAEVFNDERFVNTMNELVALMNPVGQAYGLPDFSKRY